MAKPIIAIEVENRNFVKLFDCERGANGHLNLTTVERRQKKALVKVFLIKNKKKTHLYTFTVERLADSDTEKPKIDLKGKLKQNKKLELDLFVEGKQYSSKTVDIGRYLRPPFIALIGVPLIIIAVCVLLFFLFFRENVFDSNGEAGRPALGIEREEEMAPQTKDPKKSDEAEKPEKPEETEEEEAQARVENTDRGPEEPSGEEGVSREGLASDGPAEEDGPGAEKGEDDKPAAGTGTQQPESAPPPAVALETKQWAVYFNPDSARLTDEARRHLAEIRNQLQAYPEGKVVISGHCALFGTERGRTELSEDRARNVLQYLLESSWDPEREPDVKGVGGKQYVTDERDKQYLNRRVEITLSY